MGIVLNMAKRLKTNEGKTFTNTYGKSQYVHIFSNTNLIGIKYVSSCFVKPRRLSGLQHGVEEPPMLH